jgi:hypothetical protein
MAVFTLTSCTVLAGTAWSTVAPGDPGTQTVAGSITGSTDLTAMIASVDISIDAEEKDFTNFASGGWRIKKSGLKSGMIQLNFWQDFAASQVDALLGIGGSLIPFAGSGTYYLDIKPTSSARSATNPSTVCQVVPLSYAPIKGSVGDEATVGIQYPTTGQIARLTA